MMDPAVFEGGADISKARDYFEIYAERGTKDYWMQVAQRGFEIAIEELQGAYRDPEKSDDKALKYLEELAAPAFKNYKEFPCSKEPKLGNWASRAMEEIGEKSWSAGRVFDQPISSDNKIDLVYERAKELSDNRFDYIVGVYASGIPHMYAVSSTLDSEELVFRYSRLDRGDREVKTTKKMDEKADMEDSTVLIVDDLVSTGDTMRKVGNYAFDRGAEEVRGIAGSKVPQKNIAEVSGSEVIETPYYHIERKRPGTVKLNRIEI